MSASTNEFAIRPNWLASQKEDVRDPERPIIDAHHHVYDRPSIRYLFDDFLNDLQSGHNVRASVFVQARAMLRADGPADYKAIGEIEFVNGIAAMSASGLYGASRACAGIVGFADLTQGEAVRPVLERLIMAGGGRIDHGGRFCGIRQTLCWDNDSALLNPAYPTSQGMMDSAEFRAGFAQLAPLGLTFDAWAFFPQLPDLARLAEAFPDTPFVVNHCGGIVRVRDYQGQQDIRGRWKRGIDALARCPNVTIKLSGLGMRMSDFGFSEKPRAPSSDELAAAWAPWVDYCIESFGASRCMWGSNFPVDKGSYSYAVGLNAMKILTSGGGENEIDQIFWKTANDFYRLNIYS